MAATHIRAALFISSALFITSCDEASPSIDPPESAPVARTPQSPVPPLPTPHLDELCRIFNELPREGIWLTAHVYPIAAGLKFDESAAHNAPEQLITYLEEQQPAIQKAIELSRQTLEPFPPTPDITDSDPDAHVRHPKAWIQNIVRILLADASRLFDTGDMNGACIRIAASLRFAVALLNQDDGMQRIAGSGIAAQASRKLASLVSEGDPLKVTPTVANEIRAALAGIDSNDPAGLLKSWESDARASVAECRKTYGGKGGAAKYAEYLREWGIDTEAAAMASARLPTLDPALAAQLSEIDGLLPEKQFAAQAARLSTREINAAFDRAEAMIPALAAALKAEDAAAVAAALKPVREDPTQLSRLAVGGASLALSSARSTREAVRQGIAAAESLPR